MLVTVIIPNYNGLPLLKRCLAFLTKQSLKDFEVVVIDNGSRNGSVEEIKNLKLKMQNCNLKFKIILNKKNLGFAKAVNQGIKRAEGEYVFLLNNDVVLKKDYLKKLVDFLEKRRDFWMVQGIILTEDGKKN